VSSDAPSVRKSFKAVILSAAFSVVILSAAFSVVILSAAKNPRICLCRRHSGRSPESPYFAFASEIGPDFSPDNFGPIRVEASAPGLLMPSPCSLFSSVFSVIRSFTPPSSSPLVSSFWTKSRISVVVFFEPRIRVPHSSRPHRDEWVHPVIFPTSRISRICSSRSTPRSRAISITLRPLATDSFTNSAAFAYPI
jgi:hypothetical protein